MSFGDFDNRAGNGGNQVRRDLNLNPPALGLTNSNRPPTTSAAATGADPGDDYRRIRDRASHAVFLISNNVVSIQKFVGQLGSPKDTADMRHKLHTLTEETRDMIKQTSTDLKLLSAPEHNQSQFDERQRKIAQQKLQKDFEDVLRRFQTVSKSAAEKSRDYVHKARAQQHLQEEEESATESQPLMGNSQRLQQLQTLDNEIEYNESLIQEREEDLRNIERSIVEVNEIFRDLGTLVHEQGYMLDNIESNVGSVAINMENATGELRTAARYQKMSQNKMCCLFIILGVIGVIVVLVILS
ncbi:hypothetical protein HDU76_011635 [Blyttiomyces sp. JEL0837]|nr:hypothetical protein HDU76_011635 [Blyttiomyces sp. JEL0837]